MDENNSIQLFEDRKIRTGWDEEKAIMTDCFHVFPQLTKQVSAFHFK